MIPLVSSRPQVIPEPVPIPLSEAAITPSAQKHFARLYGRATGSRLIYADLNAFAWWYGGGWLTVNRGRRGLARAHRGAEDVTQIRR